MNERLCFYARERVRMRQRKIMVKGRRVGERKLRGREEKIIEGRRITDC